MAKRLSKLGLTIQVDPAEGSRQLMDLFAAHKGVVTDVAAAVDDGHGVSHSTLKRWIEKLELREVIDELRTSQFGLKPAAAWDGHTGSPTGR